MKFIDENIERYCLEKSTIPSQNCKKLEQYTRENSEWSQMLVGEMEGSFLGFLLRAIRAKRVLEIGTYTGYSALVMAENIAEDAEIVTLDFNEETVNIGKKFWQKSPQGVKIRSVLGQALESMQRLEGKFDLIFIDADKENYVNYLDKGLELLSEHGIFVIDNCLWSGRVLNESGDESDKDASTNGIRKLNDYVKSREDLYGVLLPIRDGMFMVIRNGNF